MDDARRQVADQAADIAAGWSPPDAPATWALTAETFRAVASEPVLLDLAAAVPGDRLPALLLSAAVRFLVARDQPEPLVRYYPTPGSGQPLLDAGFRPALAGFAGERRDELASLCARHRYQMNEVGRSVDVLAVLGGIDDPRPLALVDLGTGAGLGLHLDRYRYRFVTPDGASLEAGDPTSPVELTCALRGTAVPSLRPPVISERVGIDIEPLDLGDPDVAAWLAACVPPETGAVDRFAAASALARAYPETLLRGDAVEMLASLPSSEDALLCVVDTYVAVFFTAAERARLRMTLLGLGRDVEWISVDPLVPLGALGGESVQGLPVPPRAVEACRAGVTGVVGRFSVRDGSASGRVLGLAHPGAAWLEWFGP